MPRRRHSAKAAAKITWYDHRSGYPSPEERAAILQRREQLRIEFISLLARDQTPESPAGQRLIEKYGRDEVNIILKQLDKAFRNDSFVDNDAFAYRNYRQRYARFGGARPLLTVGEYQRLMAEHSENFVAALKKESFPKERQAELSNLLLMDSDMWEDITPEDIPPHPADFPKPILPYREPLTTLLAYGSSLLPPPIFVSQLDAWRKHTPTLTRLALDPALLNGWPADPASWGPWYALHLLGELGAAESAYALGELADLENDWLSDRLPEIWANMGLEAEPFLWILLDDPTHSIKKRGLAANALQLLADEETVLRRKVIDGFGKIIANPATNPILNAYLIHFLGELGGQNLLRPEIEAAFAENRVDTDAIELDEMEWMDNDDDEKWRDDE
jgi:hypothetical protein